MRTEFVWQNITMDGLRYGHQVYKDWWVTNSWDTKWYGWEMEISNSNGKTKSWLCITQKKCKLYRFSLMNSNRFISSFSLTSFNNTILWKELKLLCSGKAGLKLSIWISTILIHFLHDFFLLFYWTFERLKDINSIDLINSFNLFPFDEKVL